MDKELLRKAFIAGAKKHDGITPNKHPYFEEWYKNNYQQVKNHSVLADVVRSAEEINKASNIIYNNKTLTTNTEKTL